MNFRRSAEDEGKGGPNLTPLIDMLFLLIIFFIVSSVFSEDEKDLEVELARARAATSLLAPQSPVILNVRASGEVLLGSEPVSKEDLRVRLRDIAAETPDRAVQIRGDRRVAYEHVVAVHAAVNEAGFRKVDYKCIGE